MHGMCFSHSAALELNRPIVRSCHGQSLGERTQNQSKTRTGVLSTRPDPSTAPAWLVPLDRTLPEYAGLFRDLSRSSQPMDEPGDLPRLPADQLESPLGDLSELQPGEQAVLSVSLDIEADEAGHLWVDVSGRVRRLPVLAGLTLLAQRTERAFILWLDKQVKFIRRPLPSGRRY